MEPVSGHDLPARTKEVFVFDDLEQAAGYAAAQWIRAGTAAVARKGRFDIAVSGGKTPVRMFQLLAAAAYPAGWEKTHLFQADERYVPPDSPQSNSLMIRQTLLQRIPLPGENIHFVPCAETVEISAWQYEEELKRHFQLKGGAIPRFDLVLLGIGEDGHTASLFPSGKALACRKLLAVPVSPAGNRCARVTLTLPVLNRARRVVFLATGEKKSPAVKAVLDDPDSRLPAALVRPDKGALMFVLDREAASGVDLKR